MHTLTLTDKQLDMIDALTLIRIVSSILHPATNVADPDGTGEATWNDSDGSEWTVRGHYWLVGSRYVRWTDTDEAGIDDIEIVDDHEYESDDDAATAYAAEIAGCLG